MGLFVAIKGPAVVDAKLLKMEKYIIRFRLVERISPIIWTPLVDSTVRATWELIKAHYTTAAAEWDQIFAARRQQPTHAEGKDVEKAPPDGLEELVEALSFGHKHELNTDVESWHRHMFYPHLDETMLDLYVLESSAGCDVES